MNWKNFWDRQAQLHSNPQVQVGRIKSGITLSEQTLDDIVHYIVGKLELRPEDRLLDLCCGNGLLTQRLSRHCQEIVAFDISAEQIARAKAHAAAPHIEYLVADVSQPAYYQGEKTFDKVNLYFSFQYFESFRTGRRCIGQMLPLLKAGGKILIGDVPDMKYISHYYSHPKDRIRYHFKRLLGENDMGKFWSEREMQRIAADWALELQVLEQPAHLPYAEYRRDYLFIKP